MERTRKGGAPLNKTLAVMRDIDKELDAVEKVLAAEDATVGPISKTVIWPIVKRVLAWAVIALALFFVLRAFWK